MSARWPVLLLARELGLGGTERQLCETAKALDRSRFEPHVGCWHPEGFRADELKAAGIPVADFPVRSFKSPLIVRPVFQFGSYLRRNAIQIVHAFDVPMDIFAVPAARMFGCPIVLSSQRAHRDLTPGLFRHLLRMTDQMVDAIVVNSNAVREKLIEEDRVPASHIRLCYNGIDTDRFSASGRAPLPGASLVVGVICAFRPEKDLATLLEAFSRVRHLQPGLKLLLVGSGPMQAALKDQSRRFSLGEQCLFEPATTEVPTWLRAIDIFVLPSLSEALSNSLMEAMACGCCAVASRVGGNPELVEHERTGMLFRSGDAEDLAACLRTLIEHEFFRRRLAETGMRFIQDNFSLSAAGMRMGDIYWEMIERRGVSAPHKI